MWVDGKFSALWIAEASVETTGHTQGTRHTIRMTLAQTSFSASTHSHSTFFHPISHTKHTFPSLHCPPRSSSRHYFLWKDGKLYLTVDHFWYVRHKWQTVLTLTRYLLPAPVGTALMQFRVVTYTAQSTEHTHTLELVSLYSKPTIYKRKTTHSVLFSSTSPQSTRIACVIVLYIWRWMETSAVTSFP